VGILRQQVSTLADFSYRFKRISKAACCFPKVTIGHMYGFLKAAANSSNKSAKIVQTRDFWIHVSERSPIAAANSIKK
jgi:hypothetical protein